MAKGVGLPVEKLIAPFKEKIDAREVGIFRVLFCSLMLITLFYNFEPYLYDFGRIKTFSQVPMFELFGIKRFSLQFFEGLYLCLILTTLSSLLGIKTRISLILSSVLFFLVAGQIESLYKDPVSNYVYHSKIIPIWFYALLAFSPGVTSLSLAGEGGEEKVFGFSFPLAKLTLGMVYLGPVWARIFNQGLGWFDGYTLQTLILEYQFFNPNSLRSFLVDQYGLLLIGQLAVLLWESTAFLAAFIRGWGWVTLIGGILFHVSIYVILGINFLKYFMAAYVCFYRLPLKAIKRLLR